MNNLKTEFEMRTVKKFLANNRAEKTRLRDKFAAKALQGIVAAEYGHCVRAQTWAKDAYEVADAMLKAREVGNE